MKSTFRLCLASVLLILLPACGKKDHDHAAPATTSGHTHTAPHGGLLVEIGEHAYNLELVRDAVSGKLTAYFLDGHAENFVRLKATTINLTATLGAEKQALTLRAVANSATGETVGDTSQFEAHADWLKTTARFDASVSALEIRGTRFEKIGFSFPKSAK